MSNKIYKFLVSNWKAKFLILIFTFFLWIYVSASQSLIINFPGEIPVTYQNVSDEAISVSNVDNVEIKIAVDPINLKQITEDNFAASIDLQDLAEGTYERQIQVSSRRDDVRVISVNPPKATVRIEKKISKTVPIRIKLDGQAADEYIASDTQVDRESAEISGPEQTINSIAEVVAPLKLNGENKDFHRVAKLFTYSTNGNEIKNIRITPQEVSVGITISLSGEAKTVGIKVSTAGNVADGYFVSGITTNPAVIAISGSRSILGKTKFLETENIDISALSQNKTFSAKLIVPSGLVIEEKNSQINIEVEISKIVQGQ